MVLAYKKVAERLVLICHCSDFDRLQKAVSELVS